MRSASTSHPFRCDSRAEAVPDLQSSSPSKLPSAASVESSRVTSKSSKSSQRSSKPLKSLSRSLGPRCAEKLR
eukprot:756963-Hanusia_phi.AAC.5